MTEVFRILMIDDEPDIHKSVKRLLRQENYEIISALRGSEADSILENMQPDCVVLDMKLPDTDGLSMLRSIRLRYPVLSVIIMTGYATVSDAVEAISLGAVDFIEKEFMAEKLPLQLLQRYRIWELDIENARLKEELRKRSGTGSLLGNSSAMLGLRDLISRIAATDSTVLIHGETGTGKELVARELHFQSPRADRAFIAIDCAAINDSTFESELFGHQKGAFTGAAASNQGLLRAADGGTVFFDEIGELPLQVQAKLLRTLQEREVRPVGGVKPVSVDVRLLAATNRDLEAEAEQGNFRKDLLYRLNVIKLNIPPLRERGDDSVVLFRHFLSEYSLSKEVPRIEESILNLLVGYDWPGNVRELQNAARHAAAFCQDELIKASHLPVRIAETPNDLLIAGPVLDASMEDQERHAIIHALERAEGNRRLAAQLLKIGEATIYRKIKKYGIG